MNPDRNSKGIEPGEQTDRKRTLQDFLDEYAKGSQSFIDLDPRIDFTEPVYEQVLRLRREDEAACLAQEQPTKAA